jgi:hypothetical protein
VEPESQQGDADAIMVFDQVYVVYGQHVDDRQSDKSHPEIPPHVPDVVK